MVAHFHSQDSNVRIIHVDKQVYPKIRWIPVALVISFKWIQDFITRAKIQHIIKQTSLDMLKEFGIFRFIFWKINLPKILLRYVWQWEIFVIIEKSWKTIDVIILKFWVEKDGNFSASKESAVICLKNVNYFLDVLLDDPRY